MIETNLVIVLLVSIIAAQTLASCFKSVVHKRERKDLYDRIMSKDLTEYSRNASAANQRKAPASAHKKVLEEWRNGGGEL